MSAAIMAPSPAPHDRPPFPPSTTGSPNVNTTTASTNSPPHSASPNTNHSAPVPPSPAAQRAAFAASSGPNASRYPVHHHAQHPQPPPPPHRGSRSPRTRQNHGKSSPSASRVPTIVVKKEPTSPEMPPRHRPRKLDLSKTGVSGPASARPFTALGVQEVGLACLSPGLVTQDPNMKEQLQRSMTVREQQRAIIEARLLQQSGKGDGSHQHGPATAKDGGFSAKTPGMSRRNKAPPGLSIVAPAHEVFHDERVVQSAPLGQTFTGLGHGHPLTRHIANQPATKLSNTSHIHPVPHASSGNRLPPLSDVFNNPHSHSHSNSTHEQQQQPHSLYPPNRHAPLPSPSHPPPHMTHGPPSSRPRDFKSAEEAQAELAGGRPELLPKIVHYGSHQPPTPPSPHHGATHPHHGHHHPSQSMQPPAPGSAQKRRRAEYEEGNSPPLGHGPSAHRGMPPQPALGPFGYGRDSPETQRAKKEEFMQLCGRAWDLFHS